MPSFPSDHAPVHAPLVRWFWRQAFDHAFDEDQVRRELAALRAKGYGGLLLWPPAAPLGYLGQEWMQRVQIVAETCRAQNLVLWLPDDWLTPSGRGELARSQNERSQNGAWSLRFSVENLSREAAAQWQAPGEKPIGAWAAPQENKDVRWSEARDLLLSGKNNSASGGAAFAVADFNEDVQVVSFFAERDKSDIDRLAPSTANSFLQLTHEAYSIALGAEFFGSTIRGFWTSGPPLNQSAFDRLPWSLQLPEAFYAQHGYELLPQLAALIAPTGADAVMVRQHFWQTVGALLEDNWWQPLRRWCEEKHLQLAHWVNLDGEESFNQMVRAYADFTSPLRAAHRLIVTAQESPLLTRLTASVAALEDQTPPLALWLEDDAPQERVPVLHQLWQHGVGGHIAPPEEPFQPFAPALENWNEQLSRVEKWLADSRPAGRIGLLLSSRSIWAHYHPKGHRFTRLVWEAYLSATSLLDELHFDFLLVDEDDVSSGVLQDGHLLCGRAQIRIEVLVLPGATTLSWELWRRLKEFVENGGKVLCLGLLPRWSERGRDEELQQAVSQTTMLTVADLYSNKPLDIWGNEESSTGFPITRQNEREGRWACYQPALNPDRDDARLRLRQMLKDSLPAPLEMQSQNLRFARRETKEGNLFFLSNPGASQAWHLRLRPTQEPTQEFTQEQSYTQPALFEYDAVKGASKALLAWSQFSENEGDGFGLDLTPAASQSYWIECRMQKETPLHFERASFAVESYDGQAARGYALHNGEPRFLFNRDGRFQSRRGPSVRLPSPLLLSDEWQARRHGSNIWRLNEWFRADSLPPTTAGHSLHSSLHSSFEVAASSAEKLQLWAHLNDAQAQLSLNGAALPPSAPPFLNEPMWTSLQGAWFRLAPLLAGHNALDCSVPASREVPTVLFVGDFDLNEEEAIGAPQDLELSSGSWHEQGLPWFAGAVDYRQVFKVPEVWKNCRVFLEVANVREGVAVVINDTPCGTRLFPPWRFDVTAALKTGAPNALHLCVWNSLAPLLEATEPSPSGLLGPVRLVAYPFIEVTT